MRVAIDQATAAFELGETPVGAVLVVDEKIICAAHNRIELDHDPTAHAEILAIRRASAILGDWRLLYSTLYVTIEPCIMCASALLHARVPKIVYGAPDSKWGAFGSLFDLAHDPRLNHEIEVISGVMRTEAVSLLRNFFLRIRNG